MRIFPRSHPFFRELVDTNQNVEVEKHRATLGDFQIENFCFGSKWAKRCTEEKKSDEENEAKLHKCGVLLDYMKLKHT